MTHSKYLNSGLIANSFNKKLTLDVLRNNEPEKKLKEFSKLLESLQFIKAELDIYDQITETYASDRAVASKLLSEIKKDIVNKKWNTLQKERQIFYDGVRRIYPDISEGLNEKTKNYKFFASIKNLIDDTIFGKLNAKDRMMIEENIVSTITSGKHIINELNAIKKANTMPDEADPLVVDVMINEFSKKWKNILSTTQYDYLIEYMAYGNSINKKWLNKLKKKMKSYDTSLIRDSLVKDKIDSTKTILESKDALNKEEILNYAELIDQIEALKNEPDKSSI